MVLDWYPASGVNVDAVGELSTVKKPAADAATLCGLAAPAVTIVTCTVEAPALVPVCMVIFAVVASTRVQSASAPPTKALHLAAASCADVTKLAPVTVIVLLTYPASGIAPVTLGGGRTTNPDFAACTNAPPLFNVTFTSEAPAIDAPNTTITLDEDETKHDAAAV